jgi:WD40 repeat protein/tetratricopeptide (TPR) repeat protein/predicted Ser/Thr protein kinase
MIVGGQAMAATNDKRHPLYSDDSARLEQVIDRFDEAWHQGLRPTIDQFLPPTHVDSLALLRELVHVEMEWRLRGGEAVRVEGYLQRYPALVADRDGVLELLAAEFRLRRRADPQVVIDEYLTRFPQYQAELPSRLERLGGTPQPVRWASDVGTAPPTTGPDTLTSDLTAPQESELPSLPDYEVLRAIGKGGMGRVFLARHRVLERLVAIKMPLKDLLGEEVERERFLREARAAAGLRHPHICPIYEVGQHADGPFIAMGYIQGENLRAWAKEHTPSPRQAAEIVATLARAIGHAHDRGVIHRDIKPANVMIDAETGQPVLMDFGLAKQMTGEGSHLTHTGQIMGTPAYMAPEQAAGRLDQVGPAADVYALGAVLYELLTGRPPFEGAVGEVVRKVQTEEPVPPRKLLPRLHRDLETICLRAIAKDPARRYASAAAMADDLARFNSGEAILARREGLPTKLWRKVRRHPGLAASVLVVLGLAGAAYIAWSARENREITELNRRISAAMASLEAGLETGQWAEKNLEKHLADMDSLIADLAALDPDQAVPARRRLHQSLARAIDQVVNQPGRLSDEDVAWINRALATLQPRAPELARPLLQRRRERYQDWDTVFELKPPFANFRKVLAGRSVRAKSPQRLENGSAGGPYTATVVTSVGSPGNVRLDADLGMVRGPATEFGLVLSASLISSGNCPSFYSPDGRMVVTGSPDGTLALWDASTGKLRRRWQGHQGPIHAVVFSPSGAAFTSAGQDGVIRLWDADQGEARREIRGTGQAVLALAYSSDGRWLASKTADGAGRVWDMATGREKTRFAGSAGGTHSVAFAPDSRTLAAVSASLVTGSLLDPQTGRVIRPLNASQWKPVTALAFSPDGQTIALASECGSVGLLETATGNLRMLLFRTYADEVWSVAFSPDGRLLATGHGNGTVKIWSLPASYESGTTSPGAPSGVELAVIGGAHKGRVIAVAFTPDGGMAASLGADGSLGLHAVPHFSGQGYAFMVSTREPTLGGGTGLRTFPAATLAEVQKKGGQVRMQIVRHGVLQRETINRVGPGPLRLRVRRERNMLEFRVNDLPPVVFFDTMPVDRAGKPAVFGLYWPRGVSLARLQAKHQSLPAPVSPLEKGDAFYDRQDFAHALSFYREQAQTARATEAGQAVRREAQCKAALCLVALNRSDEAEPLFERVAAEVVPSEEPWPLLATFHLWLLRVEKSRFEEAEQFLTQMQHRYPDRKHFEELAALVPDDLRARILRAYNNAGNDRNAYVILRPEFISQLERAVKVGDIFHDQIVHRLVARSHLLWAYRLAGQDDRTLGQEMVRQIETYSAFDVHSSVNYLWLKATYDDPRAALDRCDKVLFSSPGVLQPLNDGAIYVLLLQRARLHLALKEPAECEKDLELIFQKVPAERLIYWAAASARLCQGFLHADRADQAGAQKAWRQGLLETWRKSQPRSAEPADPHPDILREWILADLTDTLTDAQANDIMAAATGKAKGIESRTFSLARSVRIGPAVIRELWRTRRGRQHARRIAYGELTWPEEWRGVMFLGAAEYIHQEALPGALAQDQEELIWQLVHEAYASHVREPLDVPKMVALGLAWKGNPGLFGWASVRDKLPPAVRGPGAYLLGKRYWHVLKKPARVVRPFFQTALKDAPPNSVLRRLAQEELDRLKGNNPLR